MAVQTSRRGRAVAGDASGGDRPFFGKNPVMNVIDAASVGAFAFAGLGEEVVRRKEGRKPRSFARAALTGIKDKRSWTEVTGSVPVGLTMDIVIDPINFIPGGSATKLAKAAKLPQILKKASKATDAIRAVRAVKEGLGEVFIPAFKLAKRNPDKLLKMRNRNLNEVGGKAVRMGKKVHDDLVKLVPDVRRREHIFKLLEDEPLDVITDGFVDLQKPSTEGISFQQSLGKLTRDERKAFDLGKDVLKELEDVKLRAGLLTQERAAGFLKSAGIRYVPRRQARKGYTIARLEELADALRRGDPAVDSTAKLSDVEGWISQLREMDEMLSVTEIERLRRFHRGELGLTPAWLKRRLTKGKKVDELGGLLEEEINQDIAVVLGMETANVARAEANTRYVKGLVKFLQDSNLLFDEGLINDPRALKQSVISTLGEAEGISRLQDTFVTVKKVDELAGKLVPKSIADEIDRAIKGYKDPEFMKGFLDGYTRIQNIWKAHTLALFPSYHSRNVVSNLWNNSLAGMDPIKDIKHYRAGFDVLVQATKGDLDDTVKIFKGMTAKQLWESAMDLRVVRGGEFAGEIGDIVNRHAHVSNLIGKVIEPSKNWFVKQGFKTGQFLEDHARLSHYMWRLSKGDSATKASESVMKYLFDYKYGLTHIEQKLFRDKMIPFYAWLRFNLPLQLEMIVHSTPKFTAFGKTKRAIEDQFGGPEPEEVYLQDWIKRSNNIRIGYDEKTGVYEYFMLDSWWPASDLSKLFANEKTRDDLLGMVSPFPKLAVEMIWNYNLFQGRKIAEFTGQKKRLFESERLHTRGVNLPARLEHMLRQVRGINEADRFLEALDRGITQGLARPMLGRVYPIDIEKQREYWNFAMGLRIRELKKHLRRAEREGNEENIRKINEQLAELDRLKREREHPPGGQGGKRNLRGKGK